jgi:hypothetical protein
MGRQKQLLSSSLSRSGQRLTPRMHLKMDDGMAFDVSQGDVVSLPAGHTAWVVGTEPVVWLDFQGGKTFAK